jgi:hypothetical protein
MRTFPLTALAVAALVAGCADYDQVRPSTPTSSNATTSSGVAVNAPPPGTVVVAPPPGSVVVAPQQATAPQPTTISGLYAGTGRVVSVSKAKDVPTTGSGTGPANRVALVMDNGMSQYVDTYANLTVGERVEITPDARIRYAR